MKVREARASRPSRATVAMVVALVGAMLIGSAGTAVAAKLITSAQIKNGTIRNVDIKNNTITGKKIRNGSLSGADVKNGSLTAKDIRPGSLTGELVKDGSLTGTDLAEETVTRENLAPESRTHWVAVSAAGSRDRGSEGTSVTRDATGIYRVLFPLDVRACGYSATIGNLANGAPSPGVVFTTPQVDDSKGVYVETYSLPSAVRSDRPFYVTVNC